MRSHLILGGAGFIGRHIGREYADRGEAVLSVDVGAGAALTASGVTAISADLLAMSGAELAELMGPHDVVHHLIWSSVPASAEAGVEADLARNVGFTVRLIEALKGGSKRLVFASSGGTVYGRNDGRPLDERQPCRPVGAYGAGKAAAEAYLIAAAESHGLDVRIARLSNPFGAGQSPSRPQGAASRFIRHALSGERIEVWGDGRIVRDFIHIGDAVAGWTRLEGAGPERLRGDRIFNIGSGRGASLNELIGAVAQIAGRALEVRYTPQRSFDVPCNILDVRLAWERLGWRPALSLLDGVQATADDLSKDPVGLFSSQRPLIARQRDSQLIPPSSDGSSWGLS